MTTEATHKDSLKDAYSAGYRVCEQDLAEKFGIKDPSILWAALADNLEVRPTSGYGTDKTLMTAMFAWIPE